MPRKKLDAQFKDEALIPPELGHEIMALNKSGKSGRQIAQIVEEKFKRNISYNSIYRFLIAAKRGDYDDNFLLKQQEWVGKVGERTLVDGKNISIQNELIEIVSRKNQLKQRSEEMWANLSPEERKRNLTSYTKLVQLEQKDSQLLLSVLGVEIIKDEVATFDQAAHQLEEKLNKIFKKEQDEPRVDADGKQPDKSAT